jgi:hypothetical protein
MNYVNHQLLSRCNVGRSVVKIVDLIKKPLTVITANRIRANLLATDFPLFNFSTLMEQNVKLILDKIK